MMNFSQSYLSVRVFNKYSNFSALLRHASKSKPMSQKRMWDGEDERNELFWGEKKTTLMTWSNFLAKAVSSIKMLLQAESSHVHD